MKRVLTFLALVGLVIAQYALAQSKTAVSAEERTIRSVDTKWQKAAADRDLITMVESYTDDAIMMEPGLPAFVGKTAIREQWRRELGDKAFALTWSIAALEIRGDMAFTRGRYDVTYTDEKGVVVDEVGKYIVVWKKIGTDWKVSSEIYNADGSPKERS